MQNIQDKIRRAGSKFLARKQLTSRQFAKRFKRELGSAGSWFIKVGLAKSSDSGDLINWEPTDDLPEAMYLLFGKPKSEWSSRECDFIEKCGLNESIAERGVRHFAVMLVFMHCLDQEAQMHEAMWHRMHLAAS
jgi:hypothetical protein